MADVLDDLITDTSEKQDAEIEKSEKEASDKAEAKKEAKAETKEDDEDSEEDDKIDVKQAKNLYRALSDPKTAGPIIRALAEQAGLLESSTKTEKKEIKKSVQDVFREALGEDLGFLADKLGPAIEKVIAHYDSENKSRFEAIARDKTQNEVNTAIEKLYSDFDDAAKFEDRIIELMDEVTPGPNIKTYDYMKKLYRIAKSEKTELDAKTKMKKKLSDTENDATARLSSSGTDKSSDDKAASKGSMSLDESIAAAMNSIKV